jgi:adenine-specific DNA-methyltransferase
MDKLKLHSPNLTEGNIAKIAELFPSCIVEAKDDNGTLTQQVDFDQLRQELSDSIVEGPQERYRMDWPGKRESLLAANTPITMTLRPCRKESLNFDTTQNLFVEGDNLDALKLLQETYLGRVKMIYIDPPYNTGNDFVYDDNFRDDSGAYEDKSNQRDQETGRLVANLETNGRFHSDWLTMIYSRIRLAKNLLADDGVIFISIDDNEVQNLRKICDEVFGEKNLVSQICHKSRASISNDKIISSNHNHILLYAKSFANVFSNRSKIGLDPDLSGFSNPDEDDRGPWKSSPVDGPGGAKKGNPYYEFLGVTGYFRYSKETMEAKHRDGLILKTERGLQQKYFLSQAKQSRKTDKTWWDDGGLTSTATRKLQNLMGGKSFDTPKPVELVERMLRLMTFDSHEPSIILDFFAGSGTTAHAVMQMNAEDGGNRRFILIQLAEACNEKSEARNAGYETISDISKERIRRAAKMIQEENATTAGDLDMGFRVLKIDTSNAKDIYYTPDAISQEELALQVDHIKEDRTAEDLLFQVMLDWGVDLALPISKEAIKEKDVYFVDENAIAACFDTKINEAFVKELAKREPLRVVFRDTCFESDSAKINVAEIFKLLSPNTDIKTI